MSAPETLVHGTCIALGESGVLLRGRPAAGKSDLALRLMAQDTPLTKFPPAVLVADDQVLLRQENGVLTARCPVRLIGKLEVRGIGIIDVPHAEQATLRLVVDLVPSAQVPRLPPAEGMSEIIQGVTVPVVKLAPFEASASLKVRLALRDALSDKSG